MVSSSRDQAEQKISGEHAQAPKRAIAKRARNPVSCASAILLLSAACFGIRHVAEAGDDNCNEKQYLPCCRQSFPKAMNL
jgi:hypothetical protein